MDLPKLKIDDVLAWDPCYDREELEAAARGVESATIREILDWQHVRTSGEPNAIDCRYVLPIENLADRRGLDAASRRFEFLAVITRIPRQYVVDLQFRQIH